MKPAFDQSAAEELSRLLKLLNHPLRSRILRELSTAGAASPSELARRFGDCAPDLCNHHVGVLLREEVVARVGSRPVRGATTARIYQVRPRSDWPFSSQWDPLVDLLVPTARWDTAQSAVGLPLLLDRRGAEELTELIGDIQHVIDNIQDAASQRQQGGGDAGTPHPRGALTVGFFDLPGFTKFRSHPE